MKKIGFSILSLMLICCFVFIGCSSSAGALKVAEIERIDYSQATTLNYGEDVTVTGEITNSGNVKVEKVINEKTHYGVFSVLENKMMYAFSESDFELESTEYTDYVVLEVVTEEKTTYKIVTLSGETLYDNVLSQPSFEYEKFEKYAYEAWTIIGADESKVVYLDQVRLKDGKRSDVFEYPLIKKGYVMNTSETIAPAVFTLGEKAKNYMMDSVELANGDIQTTIYTKKGKVKSQYVVSMLDFVESEEPVFIGHEAILQYAKSVDAMSDDYDFIVEGEKYDLVTYRLNGITGKMKEVKCNYLLGSLTTELSTEYAYGMALEVVGKNFTTDDVENLIKLVKVNAKGKVETFNYMYSTDIQKLADDRYITKTTSGETHILDEDLQLVVNLGKVDEVMATSERLFVVRGKEISLIDFDGVLMSNTPAYKPKEYIGVVNDCLLVYNEHDGYREYLRIDQYGNVTTVFTLTDGVYAYGTMENIENILVSKLGILVSKTSTTEGNTVYEFYGFDGTCAGTWDIETVTENYTTQAFGGEYETDHLVVTVGEVSVLLY